MKLRVTKRRANRQTAVPLLPGSADSELRPPSVLPPFFTVKLIPNMIPLTFPLRALRVGSFLCLGIAGLCRLSADPLNCDLSAYTAATGLTATVEKDVLTVTWADAARGELRARYVIDHGQPMIRELAVHKAGGSWAVLGHDLTPEFGVKTGHRRIDFVGLGTFGRAGPGHHLARGEGPRGLGTRSGTRPSWFPAIQPQSGPAASSERDRDSAGAHSTRPPAA